MRSECIYTSQIDGLLFMTNFLNAVGLMRLTNKVVLFLMLLLLQTVAQADELNLQQYKGQVIVVDFWASWCVPCRQSFPWLNQMQKKFAGKGLVIIGVNVDRERADAEQFLREVPANFKNIYDPEGKLAAQYKLTGMPSSLVFDSSGQLVETHVGFKLADRDKREATFEQMLAKSAKH
jgi:cytochrome c biogenesis protein CcmG, thiol:disulfide interchange protein DsbE